MAILPALADPEALADSLEGEDEMTPYLGRIAMVAGLGGLLFGFDTGIIGGILITISTALHPCPSGSSSTCIPTPLTSGEEELIVSSTTLGALIGSLVAGWVADRWGRKTVIIAAAGFFILGAVEQGASDSVGMMVLGRWIVGVGIGLVLGIHDFPVYLAELSPPSHRGRIVALIVVLVTGGQVLAYLTSALFYHSPSGWRYMSLISCLPAILQLLLSFSLPESPRHSILRGDREAARRTLQKLYPRVSAEGVERKVDVLERGLRRVREEVALVKGSGGVVATLWVNKANRRALIVACGLQLAQQATGFKYVSPPHIPSPNSLLITKPHSLSHQYVNVLLPKLLARLHFSNPSLIAILIALTNFLCTLLALRLIDRSGRRPLLLRSLAGMAVGLAAVGGCMIFVGKGGEAVARGPGLGGWVTVLAMVGFCAAFALGMGNVPWIVQSEVFTHQVRSIGNACATATNWSANLIVSSTFLHLSDAISYTGVFWLYALLALLALWFVYAFVPETKGLTLEEAQRLFEGPGYRHIGGVLAGAGREAEGYAAVLSEEEEEEGR